MARKRPHKAMSIAYPINLADLNTLIADKTRKPTEAPFWSKNWLEDIPKELRLMVYERYFEKQNAIVHASPNHDYVHKNGKTSHDFIFPNCPKSKSKKSIHDIYRSHKNLFFVSKGVKHEAYEIYLKRSIFWLQPNTCTMTANFLQYQPVTTIGWAANMADETENVPKMASITRTFSRKKKLSAVGMLYILDAPEQDLPMEGVRATLALIPQLRDINSQRVYIRFEMPSMYVEGNGDVYVLIKPTERRFGPCCYSTKTWSNQKKDFFEEIEIYAPEMKRAELLRDFFVDAMVADDDCSTCNIVYFYLFTSHVQGKEGRERKSQFETQIADIEAIRREIDRLDSE